MSTQVWSWSKRSLNSAKLMEPADPLRSCCRKALGISATVMPRAASADWMAEVLTRPAASGPNCCQASQSSSSRCCGLFRRRFSAPARNSVYETWPVLPTSRWSTAWEASACPAPSSTRPRTSSSRPSVPLRSASRARNASFTRLSCPASSCVATRRPTNFSNSERSPTCRIPNLTDSSTGAWPAWALAAASQGPRSRSEALGRRRSSLHSMALQVHCAPELAPETRPQSGSRATAAGKSCRRDAMKGYLPESMKNSITPQAHTSQPLPKLPCHTSGAMKGGVPATCWLRASDWENIWARPKSTTTTCSWDVGAPLGLDIMTFSGFRSLWMTPRAWQYATASSVCCMALHTHLSHSRGSLV
mmetsp:Transcript_83823/g.224726  ORF Transcript_83823/g.224726 Transcript_83823/m.224726 type:complete len:361 (-) Transcript_83823:694-1776(-)